MNQLQVINGGSKALDVAPQNIEFTLQDVKKYFCDLATDKEAMVFLQLCKSQNLNPWRREAYLIKYDSSKPAQTVVGKDLFTKRAMQHPKFKGFRAGVILRRKEDIIEQEGAFTLQGDALLGGWCEVFLEGYSNPIKTTVSMSEYNKGQSSWNKIPATMIRKVALVQALREAFPDQLGGLYDESEGGLYDESEMGVELADTQKNKNQIIEVKAEEASQPLPVPQTPEVRCKNAFERFKLSEDQIKILTKRFEGNWSKLLEEFLRISKDKEKTNALEKLLKQSEEVNAVPNFDQDEEVKI